MRKQYRAFSWFLRLMAVVIVLVPAGLALVPPNVLAGMPYLSAWSGLALALGAAMGLFAIASLMQRETRTPPDVTNALSRIQQQSMELAQKLNDLELMMQRTLHTDQAPLTALPHKDHSAQLEQLAKAIADVRSISLMPDSDRRELAHMHREQRKSTAVKDLFGLVAAHEWSKAERLLITLETEFPNDDDVARGRSYLDHSRNLFEGETIKKAMAEVEELMLAANWDQAVARVHELVQGFPTSAGAQALCMRVEREYTNYCETTVQHMFDEIRHFIEQRRWRDARRLGEQLLQSYPDHRLTDYIRGQIRTLRDNAEIEERQELEVRFQEHLRDGKFDEALEIGEVIMRRFPMSPQADSLETLLPKVREMARQGAQSFAGLSHEFDNPFGVEPGTDIQPSTRVSE